MNLNGIALIIDILIGLFLLIGFVWGLKRGAFKSFLRLSFLIFNCVFWLLMTPSITELILNGNFTSLFTITLNGHTFTSLNQIISYFLSTNEFVVDLVNSSSILSSYLSQIPTIVINFVVFIFGYFILKSVTFPIYVYVANKIMEHKNKNKTPNKSNRFLGAFLGLIQSALTGMILFLPISTVALVFNATSQSTTTASGTLAINQPLYYTSSSMSNESTTTQNDMNEFLNIYYNTFLSNTLKIMSLTKLNEFIFTKLTSIEVDGVKISLAEEIKNTRTVLLQTNAILEKNHITDIGSASVTDLAKFLATANYNELADLSDQIFALKTIDLLGKDVLPFLYTTLNETTIDFDSLDETLPSDLVKIIERFLKSFQSGNIKTLHEDIDSILSILQTLQENHLLAFINDSGFLYRLEQVIQTKDKLATQALLKEVVTNIVDTLSPYSEQELQTQLISPLFASSTMRAMMPNIMNLMINACNQSLEIEIPTYRTLSVSWSLEIYKLSKTIYELKEIGVAILPKLQNNTLLNINSASLQSLPLQHLGILLNTLRESQLFKNLYHNLLPQILLKLTNSESDTNALQYINLETINWEAELVELQTLSSDIIEQLTAINFTTLDISQISFDTLQSNMLMIFDSIVVKEILYQSSSILPYTLTNYLDGISKNQSFSNIITNFTIILQEMDSAQLQQEITILLNAFHSISTNNGDTILDKIQHATKIQINSMLTYLFQSKIFSSSFPQLCNFGIDIINHSLQIALPNLAETVTFTSSDIATLSQVIRNIINLYELHLTQPITLDFTDSNSILSLSKFDLPQVGATIDLLKSNGKFGPIVNELFLQTIFNLEKVQTLLPNEIITTLSISTTSLKAISWKSEFTMIQAIIPYVETILSTKNHIYPSIQIDSFLSTYGNSALLKLAVKNGMLYLFPTVNQTLLSKLDITKSATTINGIMELMFSYLNFKNNGPVTIPLMQKYRMREGIKAVDSNPSLKAILENVSQIYGLSYTELSGLIDVATNLLEGKEFSINTLAPYIDAVQLIPWLLDFTARFSTGYKLPYYMNCYMNIIGAKITVYSVHLGKMQSTETDGTKKEVNVQDIEDMVRSLSIVPSFVTGQFVYDPTFDIRPDYLK